MAKKELKMPISVPNKNSAIRTDHNAHPTAHAFFLVKKQAFLGIVSQGRGNTGLDARMVLTMPAGHRIILILAGIDPD